MSGAGSRCARAARPSLPEDDRLEVLGTITLTGNGEGVSVTVAPVGDAVTDCADPRETTTHTCRAYVSEGG